MDAELTEAHAMEVEGFPFALNLGILGFLVLLLLTILVAGDPDIPPPDANPWPIYAGMAALGVLSAHSMYRGIRQLEERDKDAE